MLKQEKISFRRRLRILVAYCELDIRWKFQVRVAALWRAAVVQEHKVERNRQEEDDQAFSAIAMLA